MANGIINYSLALPKNLDEAQYIDGTPPIIINTSGAMRVTASQEGSQVFTLVGTPSHNLYNYGSPSTLTKLTVDTITTIKDFWFNAQLSSNSQLRIQIAICDPSETFPSDSDTTVYIYDAQLYNTSSIKIPDLEKIIVNKNKNIVVKLTYYTAAGGTIFLSHHSTTILDD